MKKKRFSEEQIIGVLREAEAALGVKELCRKYGISDATFYAWRKKYVLVAGRISNKRASTFAAPTNHALGLAAKTLCHTLTLDNGTENASHAAIAKAKVMDIYFTHPHE